MRPTTQAISSAQTSQNQLPAVFRRINKLYGRPDLFWAGVETVLDYGGGKYDKLTEVLAEHGVQNLIYDPFNRSADHNNLVRELVTTRPASCGICSNVLNVIKEPAVRREILANLKRWVEPGGYVFFTFYEGDKTSRGKRTSKGWQANRPSKSYLREVKRSFYASYLGSEKMILAEVT